MSANFIIAFGPSADSYFIGYGRRYNMRNMPASLKTTLDKGELAINSLAWLSVDKRGQTWVAYNVATQKYHFDMKVHPDIIDYLSGTGGKPRGSYVTFCDEPGCYFVKHVARGGWSGHLAALHREKTMELRRTIKDFDLGLTGMLFGAEGTHICLFEVGFQAELRGSADHADHPLHKILTEFATGGYTIERGSTLCLYDSRYYFLLFKQQGSTTVQQRWCLPPGMTTTLKELMDIAATPEEQQALTLESTMQTQLAMMQIQGQMNAMNAMSHVINQGALNVANAADPTHYRYYTNS